MGSRWVVTGGFYVWAHMAPTSNPCGAHLHTMNVAHQGATWSTHYVAHMGMGGPHGQIHVACTSKPSRAHLDTIQGPSRDHLVDLLGAHMGLGGLHGQSHMPPSINCMWPTWTPWGNVLWSPPGKVIPRALELCESRGGRPGLPVPNSP